MINPMPQTAISRVRKIISGIKPMDELEQIQINDSLAWIDSGSPIFRIARPNIPDKHLVSYFIIFDNEALKVLLVDHKLSGLWLPTGGHVEFDENPLETVQRECLEELQIKAEFWREDPIFLTSTITVGLTAGHTDVSLWYVLKGHHQINYNFDPQEFNSIRWFDPDEIPYEQSDPNMKRFISKLWNLL